MSRATHMAAVVTITCFCNREAEECPASAAQDHACMPGAVSRTWHPTRPIHAFAVLH
jgi:hypothetical protein